MMRRNLLRQASENCGTMPLPNLHSGPLLRPQIQNRGGHGCAMDSRRPMPHATDGIPMPREVQPVVSHTLNLNEVLNFWRARPAENSVLQLPAALARGAVRSGFCATAFGATRATVRSAPDGRSMRPGSRVT